MKNNMKGFTLIELLVALGLSAMVISLVIYFFIVSLKSYKSVKNQSELQFQTQYILNFMSNKIMSSESIALVKKDELNQYSLIASRQPAIEMSANKIAFKYGEETSENYVFHIVGNDIRYGCGYSDMKPTVELGSYVKNMFISLINEGALKDTNVIKIRLVLEKGNCTYEAVQVVCMRNY
ncbi:MAG: PilW family protein [Sedimentibacter sp.]